MSHAVKTHASVGLLKSLAVIAILSGLSSVQAAILQSPKGAEQQIIVVPPKKTVTIGWSYPVNFETPDLVFKIYHSTNLSIAMTQWDLMTNIPGNLRSAVLPADQPQEFFVMTASNYLGESGYGQ